MKTEMKASSKPENALGEAAEIDAFSLKMTIAASALFSVLSCILFDKTKDLSGIRMAVFGLVIVALVGGYLAFTKKLTVKNIILMLFSAGFVILYQYGGKRAGIILDRGEKNAFYAVSLYGFYLF